MKKMYYVLCLAILLAIYFTLIFFMNRLKNAKLMNAVFIALTVVCYIVLVVYVYLDVGLYDWNFLNPVFDYVENHPELDPNLLVFFTDGYGDCPDRPPHYPVMWLLTRDGKEQPWGRNVKFSASHGA